MLKPNYFYYLSYLYLLKNILLTFSMKNLGHNDFYYLTYIFMSLHSRNSHHSNYYYFLYLIYLNDLNLLLTKSPHFTPFKSLPIKNTITKHYLIHLKSTQNFSYSNYKENYSHYYNLIISRNLTNFSTKPNSLLYPNLLIPK
jgi:hypothetical protein